MGVATIEINMNCCFTDWYFVFFREGKERRSQDCPLNFLPLRQIDRDHADHPSCWLCVLSGPFSSIQTMSEVNPSTEVERKRCSNCICQVRPCKNVVFGFCMVLHMSNAMNADISSGYSPLTLLILVSNNSVSPKLVCPTCFRLKFFAWLPSVADYCVNVLTRQS